MEINRSANNLIIVCQSTYLLKEFQGIVRENFMLILVAGETHYFRKWVGTVVKILLSMFGVIFLPISSTAGIEEGDLDRTGLECEVSEKKYERDEVLKYFIFEDGEVYWLLAIDGNPAKIRKFSHGRYLANGRGYWSRCFYNSR